VKRETTKLGWVSVLAAAALVGILSPSRLGSDDYSSSHERSLTPGQERRLVQTLFDLRQGRLEDALRNSSYLVKEQPDFRLAQLVYADLLMARTGILASFGHRFGADLVNGHRAEAQARLQRYLSSPPASAVPASLLKLPSQVQAAIVVDVSTYRLYVFEQQQGQFVRTGDFYVSIGKGGIEKQREGDERTPIGVYLVDAYLRGDDLPDLYGVGAFPISYPNGWDRLHGRTGDGIWIHGTESTTYSRPPLSSLGCVTLANADFDKLRHHVEVDKTPVIVTDGINWEEPWQADRERRRVEMAIEGWRRDWESRDTDRYLSHYSKFFRTPGMNRRDFAQHKHRVNAGKRFIGVELENVGAFRYPGEENLILVDFLQHYRSDSFNGTRRKHQYWRREGEVWRIVFEESL
jgi:murein L,D-transpeptidase YafK